MIRRTFDGLTLPLLGFGTMRLPLLEPGKPAAIDEAKTAEMVEYAMAHGVNYFDTAYFYHGEQSEVVIGRVLKKYPRDSFYLATKFPGHQVGTEFKPAETFAHQLEKCGVDYFDFYLLHNVYENSLSNYIDPHWDIIGYLREEKKRGRIRYLGFSTHGSPEMIRDFCDAYPGTFDFCQIQLNYLDWSLQNAKAKYEILTQRNIPVWVMEPVRGGYLARLDGESEAKLRALRPEDSIPSWAMRWLQGLPNVKMILSGMSDLDHVKDNVKSFKTENPLSPEETGLLYELAGSMNNSIPCTACRYCCDGCPVGLDIPMLLNLYRDFQIEASLTLGMRMDLIPEDKRPSACIGCGKCRDVCPQKIDVTGKLQAYAAEWSKAPNWKQMCLDREKAKRNS